MNFFFTTNYTNLHEQKQKHQKRSLWSCRRYGLCGLWLIFLTIFLSCKSTPNPFDVTFLENSHFPLDSGASVYIFADVKQVRPIIDLIPIELLKDRQTRQMLDKTNYLAAAFFTPVNSRHLYLQLAAWGNYPTFWANMGFGFDKNWKKQQTAERDTYWYSQTNGLSISLNTRRAYMASFWLGYEPETPFAVSPLVEIPEGFDDFRDASPLSFWLGNPAPLFSRILNGFGIPLNFPLQQLFISLYPADSQGQYRASIRLKFENAVQARGMAALLSLANNYSAQEPFAAIFFANPPVINNNYIDINTAVLSNIELSLLLEMFLLYLN